MRLLTIPRAKFDSVAYLDNRRSLTTQHERGFLTIRLWDLGADAIGQDLRGIGWLNALGALLKPGGGRYLRRNGLWPEGAALPRPTEFVSLEPPHPLSPNRFSWPAAFRSDGAAALFVEVAYEMASGARFHFRDADGVLHPVLGVRRAYGQQNACGALSPDGQLAAVSWGDHLVAVYDLEARQEVGQLEQTDGVRHLSFAGADRLVVAAGRTVRLWDPRPARLLLKLPTFRKNVRGVAVSPEHRLIAIGGGEGKVGIWESSTGKCRETFDWNVGEVRSVAFSPDGSTAAAAGEKGVVIWDVD